MSELPIHEWRFYSPDPHSKARDPLHAEALRGDGFSPAESLVRESVQNSLDAHADGQGPVHIRITVSGDDAALSPTQAAPWFNGLSPHVQASTSGGHVDPDVFSDPCRFVVIEDFSTVGLTGDVTAVSAADGGNYYSFIWAEGQSGKTAGKGGRWGVGKYVFPNASSINTFFALTLRGGDPSPLLIGQAVLEQHRVKGIDYQPDGWWADQGENDRQTPWTDATLIDAFRDIWRVSREGEQTGLSVVIPYTPEELTDTEFVSTLVRTYWLALLQGRLTVDVVNASTGDRTHLDAKTTRSIIDKSDDGLAVAQAFVRELVDEQAVLSENTVKIGPIRHNERLKDIARPKEEELVRLRDEIEAGRTISFVLTQRIRSKHGHDTAGTAKILLRRLEDGPSAPAQFFRSGILISEAAPRQRLSGVQALVVVGDDPLGALLGDSESPAHTKWEENDRVKDRYVQGRIAIGNVRTAPKILLEWLDSARREEDRIIFSDIFNVTEVEGPRPHRRTKARKKGAHTKTGQPAGETHSHVPQLVITEREPAGDLVIIPTEDGRQLLGAVKLRAAYTLANGKDPYARWSHLDFTMGSEGQLTITCSGASVTRARDNRLEIDVDDPAHFALRISGFDPQRDLTVDVRGQRRKSPRRAEA